MTLAVDVISDVICPWCYIGKKRPGKAIARFEGQQEVRVRWLPFQLNPTMPKEGISRKEYRIRKFGSWERSMELEPVVAVGETEGFQFAFDRIERTPNTVDVTGLFGLPTNKVVGCVVSLCSGILHRGRDTQQSPNLIDVVAEAGQAACCVMLSSEEGMMRSRKEDLSRAIGLMAFPSSSSTTITLSCTAAGCVP